MTIAHELARRLGSPCVSFEDLCQEVTKFEGFTKTVVEAAFTDPASLAENHGKRIALLNTLRAALVNLSQNGNAVYHGFAGHLLLANVSNILRVRLIASVDYRIHEEMKVKGVSHDQAVSLIKREDEESAIWSRILYGVDMDDPSLFDVSLSLNTISPEDAVNVLVQMSLFDAFIPSETSQREFGDLQLGSDVWTELNMDPRTHAASVMVVANLGHVTVYGFADSEKTLDAIPAVAKMVKGVSEVTCNVDLMPTCFLYQ
jgi:cytidylate kinase